MEDLRDPRIVVSIAIYWFIGGYIALVITPFAFQCGLVCLIIGVALLRMVIFIEDRGGRIPGVLGGLLLGSPITLMLIGAMGWGLKLLGFLGEE